MKLCSSLLVISVAAFIVIAVATPVQDQQEEAGLWDDDIHGELLVRVSRGAKDRDLRCRQRFNTLEVVVDRHLSTGRFEGICSCQQRFASGCEHGCQPNKIKTCAARAVSAGTASCRYEKSDWSACDVKTNTRSRTFTLKKGDPKTCEKTKKLDKKCKKECRYEKGTWSECVDQQMNRIDNLKPDSDRSCEKTRRRTKRCKPETNAKKTPKSDRSNKKSGKQ